MLKSFERTILVSIGIGRTVEQAEIDEFRLLGKSAGAEIVFEFCFSRSEADAKYFIGSGQAQEIAEAVSLYQADLLIFDAALSPSQERNLEKLCSCRVLDRSGLVLDIFARRARTSEGKLQVELAQLTHLSTRLVRGWTHLERQKGGIGLRGPGETQLETDRRLLNERIKQLKKRLSKVENRRNELRKKRKKLDFPTVALAGYTNSGKSTLFNLLTSSEVYVQDQVFATLDPTLCKLADNKKPEILITDTVGFISGLPHELVAAFKSTLEETVKADLILHVIDLSDKSSIDRQTVVNEVLADIGADNVPLICIFNKIDLTDQQACVIRNEENKIQSVFISAKEKLGIDLLITAIREHFEQEIVELYVELDVLQGAVRSVLYHENIVINEENLTSGGWKILIRAPIKILQQLKSKLQYLYNYELNLS